jgi:hypothetical protein
MALKLKKQDKKDDQKESGGGAGKFPSWMKSGKKAQDALDQERAEAEQRAAERNKMWRYWMKEKEDATIVFLDGDLVDSGSEEGKLDVHPFYEHTVKHKGEWMNIVCAEESGDICPLCEADDKRSLVAAFTVIDTRKIQGRNKVYENEPKLFIAKQRTITQLQKIATKRGGLRGCVFEVSRSDERAARVGDQFDFEGKLSEEELAENFGAEHIFPADYSKEITLRTADDIHELLQGTLTGGESVGSEGVGTTPGKGDVPF